MRRAKQKFNFPKGNFPSIDDYIKQFGASNSLKPTTFLINGKIKTL